MNMKFACLLFLVFFLFSCSPEPDFIYYSYNGTTITRMDDGNQIFLYFGKHDHKESLPKSYVRAEYNGFDGLMQCYCLFKDGGDVEIIELEGTFDTVKTGSKMRLIEFERNIDFIRWDDKVRGNYNNIIMLSDVTRLEAKNNLENNSKVITTYPEN